MRTGMGISTGTSTYENESENNCLRAKQVYSRWFLLTASAELMVALVRAVVAAEETDARSSASCRVLANGEVVDGTWTLLATSQTRTVGDLYSLSFAVKTHPDPAARKRRRLIW